MCFRIASENIIFWVFCSCLTICILCHSFPFLREFFSICILIAESIHFFYRNWKCFPILKFCAHQGSLGFKSETSSLDGAHAVWGTGNGNTQFLGTGGLQVSGVGDGVVMLCTVIGWSAATASWVSFSVTLVDNMVDQPVRFPEFCFF